MKALPTPAYERLLQSPRTPPLGAGGLLLPLPAHADTTSLHVCRIGHRRGLAFRDRRDVRNALVTDACDQ